MTPHTILAQAQQKRFVIEDFRPLAKSLDWELGQRYLRDRGSGAFISDQIPVPFVINNDGLLSRQAAQTFFASLVEAEKEEALEPRIFVLELGIGVGLFARFFLDAFKELCGRHGKDYYRRLTYIAGDRSERMLADACRHGVFANHLGHYAVRVVDALKLQEADFGVGACGGGWVRAVFLNYLLDCLPAADLKIVDGEVRQLFARTCLARNAPLADYTRLTPHDLARRARSRSGTDQRALLELYGLIASEYDYRPVDRSQGDIPYLDFAVRFAHEHAGRLLHNYGAIGCLEGLLELLHPRGFILINDYGHTELKDAGDFEHQRFSHATFVGINFPLLKAYFESRGKRAGTRDEEREDKETREKETRDGRQGGENGEAMTSPCLPVSCLSVSPSPDSPAAPQCSPVIWAEPLEDSGRIHSRLLAHRLAPDCVRSFTEGFSKAAYDWAEEPVRQARASLQHGRIEAALTAYYQALERQPNNWMVMNEIAQFLTFTLRDPPAGIAMARAALTLNPACSAELWNTLGDGYYELGRLAEAKNGYRRALRINPGDVKARYNLTWVLVHEQNYHGALALIAEALALDETSAYFERLTKKQAEILERLNRRNQQRMFLLANRVSNKAAAPGETGAATAEKQ